MLSDKEIKSKFKPKFWAKPEKYYATQVLKEDGFIRKFCIKCKKPFWNLNPERKVCGDPSCSGEGFKFIGKTPAKKSLSYTEVWLEFSKLFKKLGYTPIKRYPVVSRWNPTMEYTNASIAAFQPYVISGEVNPPANPLVIPQFCLRFSDIDNVGITESHNTGFVMIGQHMFVSPEKWDQNKVFRDIKLWLNKCLGLSDKDIIFHEDAWAGGGNFGCCMEFFSRGCEIGNQVYMLYEQTNSSYKELPIKVLDMGMGMERNAWFSQGSDTIYDATFPKVIKNLKSTTGIKVDKSLIKKYVPNAALLNFDEVDDINKAWKQVARNVGVDVKTLKENILPLSGIYSIAEHARSLLFALNDGALPSNIGGGYNLRILIRRVLSFIDRYGWSISLPEVCKLHALDLKKIFPELSENLNEISEILEVEKDKYESTKQKTKQIITNIVKKKIDEEKLLELYDTQGIPPEVIKEEAEKINKKINIPEDFYARVSELHKKEEQEHATKKEGFLDLNGVEETKALYFDNYEKTKFKAKIVKIIDKNIILDKTYFYPTSGGQISDTGFIANEKVINVFKQGNVIVHVLNSEHKFPVGEEINCEIDFNRRLQLTHHHTATHILNAAARRILGKHVNQAGAKKTPEKAHLDITHYKSISSDELDKIEKEANKIVSEKIPVYSSFMSRDEAEKTFGMNIYQGGAVPGKELRIVEIPEVDVEACGGTHLKNTFGAGKIKILKSTKISDSIVRIEFTAGEASSKVLDKEQDILGKISKLLKVYPKQIPSKAEELFSKWKFARKAIKKGKKIDVSELELKEIKEEDLSDEELLDKTAFILKTQVEHLPKTISRFLKELEEMKKKIK